MNVMLARPAALSRLIAAADAACLSDAPQAALAPALADAALLTGLDLACRTERYARHLLHADPLGRYALIALVWLPGQMSPVHAHHVWCAFGVIEGTLTEHHFTPGDPPVPAACRLLGPGQSCHDPGSPDLIHRLGNLGTAPAISVHAYGAAWDGAGRGVNRILAA